MPTKLSKELITMGVLILGAAISLPFVLFSMFVVWALLSVLLVTATAVRWVRKKLHYIEVKIDEIN